MEAIEQVKSTTVTSAVSSVIMDGVTTDHVYMLVGKGITINTDTAYLHTRFTKVVSGASQPQTAAQYDFANLILKPDGAFENFAYPSRTEMYFANSPIGASAGESSSFVYYLFNFNNSSQYSYITIEDNVFNSTSSTAHGSQGAMQYGVAEAHNGIVITGDSTTITGGTITLYKINN
jgi:hypothetical protein